jgi:hypothetical protein
MCCAVFYLFNIVFYFVCFYQIEYGGRDPGLNGDSLIWSWLVSGINDKSSLSETKSRTSQMYLKQDKDTQYVVSRRSQSTTSTTTLTPDVNFYNRSLLLVFELQ